MPRPLPGEAVLSWVGRIGARYSLEASALIAWLRRGHGVHASRIAALDWRADAELDHLLAGAARLEVGAVRALRPVAAVAEIALWRRARPAWCAGCVRDDVGRQGECYGRVAWRLGGWVACPIHDVLLAEACPRCPHGRCGFRPMAGRQRLICDACGAPLDQPSGAYRGPKPGPKARS
ncbi:TniQ family protein [Siccirubricoccus sp. G192]|uniref:TniQ family protein n=1 Tax=Siccirubricoccus sp. G192 TaxID=2849651 RepID=UPI0028111509|nr:TniQ family protein [Siccirubricoccus sp. G192]